MTPPKLVEIDTYTTSDYVALDLEARHPTKDMTIVADSEKINATLYVRTQHSAREYAQHLRGAADALLAWAEQQEGAVRT